MSIPIYSDTDSEEVIAHKTLLNRINTNHLNERDWWSGLSKEEIKKYYNYCGKYKPKLPYGFKLED